MEMSKYVLLQEDSCEYKRVAANLKNTIMRHKMVRLSDFNIVKMLKIENSTLTERYNVKLQKLSAESKEYQEEVELFHGSPYIWEICNFGFDIKYSKDKNMFGQGIYFTAHASKANQYSWGANTGCPPHLDRNCTICPRYIIVCSCILGKKFYAEFQPLERAPKGFHSIVAEPYLVDGLKYPEYVVLDGDQALPKVLVEYRAIGWRE